MSTDDPRAIEVITEFFGIREAKARAEFEKASAALAQAEAEAAAFADDRQLPPEIGAMKQGWEVCSWITARVTQIGMDTINGRPGGGREVYDQAVADRLATFDWLEAHGYEVPESFREK